MRHSKSELLNIAGLSLLFLGLLGAGCSSENEAASGSENEAASGTLTVLLDSEYVIVAGLKPGDGAENIQDGWAVSFDKFIATIGDIDVQRSTDDSVEAEAAEVFVVDMTQVPASGLALWTLEGLPEGRWEFNFSTPGAADGSTRHASVEKKDYDAMVAGDLTYLIDGELTKTDGQSCPPAALAAPGETKPNGNTSGDNDCYDADTIRFTFGAKAETSFGPCEIDGVPGFAIAAGEEQTVASTLHGDHLFFNGFPEGAEGGVKRLAQWLADCDLNLDGTVTEAELKKVAPAQLPEIDERYQLGGSPITPLTNMHVYVTSQLKTQGHFQGEGECPLDGMRHQH
ncbi:MAG: hypothetical protein RJA70_4399 [Pseudomonadota bacterium]|jgi:hypothetical protein